ncbi:PREDICTED: fibroblast growth factor 5 [Nanorana parkeri]|uniref:fibroblast growth factor 5 n=1 Tax=Nanorana parkeri TaxID=125878 RepID=UPI0008548236|nr:PREDICTED: fibroblast growth factor 5 [Nanorana parkeri]
MRQAGQSKKVAEARLSFEERKTFLKFYLKFENDVEVQRQWRHGTPPHFHQDVRAYLDENLPGHWIRRRGVVEFPPRSPDLTPLAFYLWGTLKDVVYGILEIFAVSQGIVGIRGVFSNSFLAMSKKGKLHATPKFTDDCKFMERYQENSYNTYASATYRTEKTGRRWYVALNKRGKAKKGSSPRVKPQHISTHFLPRIKHIEPPELSFTVTVPEKKKTSPVPAKPKTIKPPPKKNSSPVRYRLKFRFG